MPSHILKRVLDHQDRVAIIQPNESNVPHEWTYAQLLSQAVALRDELLVVLRERRARNNELREPRIAYLGARGTSYVAIQWAIWLAGGIAVPLHPAHPVEELEYILSDSDAALLVASEEFTSSKLQEFLAKLPSTCIPVHIHPSNAGANAADQLSSEQVDSIRQWVEKRNHEALGAHIVYTSGTTGRPKGVVTTHAALSAQIHDIVSAWEMSPRDHLLHFLPLHHVHGMLNNLLCVHYAGGSVEFLLAAKPPMIWSKLGEAAASKKPVTMLMAVPTVYMLLLEEMNRAQQDAKPSFAVEPAIKGAQGLRVAISGSMACPVSILNRWHALTGQSLLERYGMTELGMVLTNPLHGERHFGYVGGTFPSVSVRLVDPDTEQEVELSSEKEGELRVKGPTVFKEYWKKPEATAKEFDEEGWFKTGDIVQYNNECASFRIRGRASADIIKSAGYKISALDVERVLLTHPEVQECAVFGVPDEKWGQIVAAVVRMSSPEIETPDKCSPPLIDFMKSHLADYRVPRKYFFVAEIPKNAMGKVNKKSLASIFSEK